MRRNYFLLLTMLFFTLQAAVAADLSGTWVGTLMAENGGSEKFLLILKQDGTEITGTAGANESDRHPLEKGTIEGDRLTFEVQVPDGTLVFDLRVNGNEISGMLRLQSASQTINTARVIVKR